MVKQKVEKNILHLVVHHSRNLKNYEKNYAITELKCLVIVDVLDKFYHYLHEQKLIIHTDHATLTRLKNVKILKGHLFCWSLKQSMFDCEIKYQKDSINIEADILFQRPVSENNSHHIHLLDLNKLKKSSN